MVDSGVYPERAKLGGYDKYSECLAHFIRDVCNEPSAPDMKFVIGVTGVGGPLAKCENNDYQATNRSLKTRTEIEYVSSMRWVTGLYPHF